MAKLSWGGLGVEREEKRWFGMQGSWQEGLEVPGEESMEKSFWRLWHCLGGGEWKGKDCPKWVGHRSRDSEGFAADFQNLGAEQWA